MKFSVKAWSKGRARIGILQLPGLPVSIETPCLLLSTRKGLPHFLSPDLLSSLPSPDSHLLQVSPLHFLEGLSTKTISNIGGLHQMLALQDYGFSAVPRDSIVCLPESDASNKMGASFQTPCGRFLIKPVEYMKMTSSLGPNWWVSLSDEVPAWVSEKRNKTSVDRTVRWLDECIMSSQTDGAVFGAIVGGCSVEERKRCAAEVMKRDVSGYWIGGFGLGENIDERPALLNAILDIVPEEKPRQVCGLGLPGTFISLLSEDLHSHFQLIIEGHTQYLIISFVISEVTSQRSILGLWFTGKMIPQSSTNAAATPVKIIQKHT